MFPTFTRRHLPLGKLFESHQSVVEFGHFICIGILLEGKFRLVRLPNHHVCASGLDWVSWLIIFFITRRHRFFVKLALVLSLPLVLVLLSHRILDLLKLISKLRCFQELRGRPAVLHKAGQAAPVLQVVDGSLGSGAGRVSE